MESKWYSCYVKLSNYLEVFAIKRTQNDSVLCHLNTQIGSGIGRERFEKFKARNKTLFSETVDISPWVDLNTAVLSAAFATRAEYPQFVIQ